MEKVVLMSYVYGTSSKGFTEKPELASFEVFAKQEGFPVSVFESSKNTNGNDINNLLAKQYTFVNAKKQRDKLLLRYHMLVEEYKRIVKEKEEREKKLAEVDYYIKVVEKHLSSLKSEEKNKFYNAIHRVKSKYGEKGAQKIIRCAEIKAWDIFKNGRNMAWDIAFDAKKMIPAKSVEEIKAASIPLVVKLATTSKDNFEEVLEKLNDGKCQ